MIFRRTPSGLSNQHLFFNVDTVIFVEGGLKSYAKEEVYEGKFNSSAIDIKYWECIFSSYHPDTKYHYRAVGSKATLESIANDIENGVVKNVFVAMDRDHSKLNNKLKKVVGVFYTFGYSWENDVLNPIVVEDVFHLICVIDRDEVDITNEISLAFQAFSNDISEAVSVDCFLSKSERSLFPRPNPSCCLLIKKNKKPTVNTSIIEDLVSKQSVEESEYKLFLKDVEVNILQDCYGHLLADFCYRLITYLLNKWQKLPKIAKHYVYLLAIDKFISRFSSSAFNNLQLHYDELFAGISV